ncbi:MAG TPA: alginate export family protein [Fimbriimonadaceae bacterium]|nr:alginate export family protein [Fimbriimonadaceae bacterium]
MLFISVPPVDLPPLQKSKWDLTPVVEVRERLERRDERDLSSLTDDDRGELGSRYRLGVDFNNKAGVGGRFRYQFAHSLINTRARNFSDEHSDVYLAHVDFARPEGLFSAGRQVVRKGGMRLFEESNFGQRSKSFDLVRFTGKGLDLFAGKVGYSGNRSDQARLVGGSYAGPWGETLIVYKHDRWLSNQNFWTFDHRIDRPAGKGRFAVEGAFQRGTSGGRETRGWWLHGRITHPTSKKTTMYLEANAASGGGDANVSHAFEPLYGTTHSVYGFSDLQGLRNMNHVEMGVTHQVNPRLEMQASVHKFELRDARDGWYDTGGRINRRPGGLYQDPTGSSGRDTGFELNLLTRYKLSTRETLQLELAVFKPGGFQRNLAGGTARDQLWGLLTYVYRL